MAASNAQSSVLEASGLGLLAEHAPDGLVLVNGAGCVAYANAAFERMLGYPRAELLGLPVERLLPEGFAEAHAGARARYTAEPEPRAMALDREVLGRRADGSLVELEIRLSGVEVDGAPHVIAVVRDAGPARRRESAARDAQAIEERAALERIGDGDARLPATARSFGAAPLVEASPEAFATLVAQYGDALDRAVEERAYRVEAERGAALRAMVERLAFLWARPRDLVEIHSVAAAARARAATSMKSAAYAEEGRLLLLELMGGLCSHYRKLSLGRGT